MRDTKQIRADIERLLLEVLPGPAKLLYAGKVKKLVDLICELIDRRIAELVGRR